MKKLLNQCVTLTLKPRGCFETNPEGKQKVVYLIPPLNSLTKPEKNIIIKLSHNKAEALAKKRGGKKTKVKKPMNRLMKKNNT